MSVKDPFLWTSIRDKGLSEHRRKERRTTWKNDGETVRMVVGVGIIIEGLFQIIVRLVGSNVPRELFRRRSWPCRQTRAPFALSLSGPSLFSKGGCWGAGVRKVWCYWSRKRLMRANWLVVGHGWQRTANIYLITWNSREDIWSDFSVIRNKCLQRYFFTKLEVSGKFTDNGQTTVRDWVKSAVWGKRACIFLPVNASDGRRASGMKFQKCSDLEGEGLRHNSL